MNETAARKWLNEAGVSRETLDKLQSFYDLIRADPHNLIARSTTDDFWVRHIVDSLQLIDLAPTRGEWIDVGSGGGLPGIPIAMLRTAPMTLVEPRKLRAGFLQHVADKLALSNVSVVQASAQQVRPRSAVVISARAVASLDRLFAMAQHLSSEETRWVLPKGRSALAELETAHRNWHARVELVPSITQEGSMIVVADQLRRRKQPRA